MSDSEHSTVTYTSVSILVEDDSDIGSPGVDGPPIMPEDPYAYIMAAYQVPPSPDYVPGLKEPEQAPPSPDYMPGPKEPEQAPPSPVYLPYVPEPVYLGYMPEQPLPAAASPTADSPGYVPESDPEEEPEEDDEDPEDMPPEEDVFPAEEQPLPAAASPTADLPGYIPESDPEEDPEEDDEEDPEEGPTDYLANSTAVALPAVDHVLSEEETEPFPQISSPPLPIPSPPLNSHTHIEIPESCLPLQKRVRFASPTPSHEAGESLAAGAARQDGPAIAREDPYSVARGDLYGFVDMVDVAPGHPMSRELYYGITDTWDDLETTIMYDMMEDAQDDRSLLRARVNLLYRDRPVHRRLAVMIEKEARMAHEAWGLSMDASDYARLDVMSLRTMVVAQSALISELQSADHRR
ncbi:hypothetical protein Tco_1480553 [Tanacetum coccineum]